MMKDKKFCPIKKIITIMVLMHIVLIVIGLSFATYRIYTKSFYARYSKQMESILSYVEPHIDNDDMSECARTYIESEKYKETQEFFDDFVDHYPDLHYLYIVKILDPDDPVGIRSICSANSRYEKENEPENVLHLGDGNEGWYDKDTVEKFREILNGDEDVLFLQPSKWGVDYTLARPLIDSSGYHYGVFCVDISLDELKQSLYKNMILNILLIVLLGLILMFMLLLWLNRNVIGPITLLNDKVKEYDESAHGKYDPDNLVFSQPELKVNNEIRLLSESIYKMSLNVRDYAKDNVSAEKKVEGLKGYVNRINDVAYYDPLTRVKNRAAYEKKCEDLETDIFNRVARFAIVMADINFLKKVNDKFGHDKGNEYIVGVCAILSDIFKRSPIFRVGGDEFVIILEGKDYANRDELIKTAREELAAAFANSDAEPWHRYSAAMGMAVYVQGEDESVENVFKRADEEMYEAKVSMKAQR